MEVFSHVADQRFQPKRLLSDDFLSRYPTGPTHMTRCGQFHFYRTYPAS
jgi:hypothetical protein